MSEKDQYKDQVQVISTVEGTADGEDERKGPKMKLTGDQPAKGKRGRKPKSQKAAEDENSEEEFNPEKDVHEGTHKNNKSEDDGDDEDYIGSDEDYDGKKPQKKRGRKSLKKEASSDTPRSGAKRGRKPKNKNLIQEEGLNTDDKTSSKNQENDETIPSSDSALRVTRTSSGRLPNHHDTYQPTFKKYKPTKKENEPSSSSLINDGQNNNSSAADDINAKRAHSTLDGTQPANVIQQAVSSEDQTEKKIKTNDS